MPSDDSFPPEAPGREPEQAPQAPTSRPDSAPAVPKLRRETMLLSTERQRIALIAACCSLAGLGLGFGAGQMVSANNNCRHQITVSHQEARLPAPTPVQNQVSWLGVEVAGVRGGSGAQIVEVVPGSPAERAGLRVGSTIQKLGDERIRDSSGLVAAVRVRPAGQRYELSIISPEGEATTKHVTLGGISLRDLRDLTRR